MPRESHPSGAPAATAGPNQSQSSERPARAAPACGGERERPLSAARSSGPRAAGSDSGATDSGPTPVAIVGAGFIADYHLEVLGAMDGVRVVAVCDKALGRARDCAARWKIEHAVSDLEELVELGVRVAHVLVPPDLHLPVVRRLIELGLSVFAEKPLVLSSSDARELAGAARQAGVALGVNHNNLYHPAFAELLQRVRCGEIGRVEHVQVTLSVPLAQLDAGDYAHWMFRAPRNIVFEQAPHPLCQVHALIGRQRSLKTTILSSRELHPGQVFHDRWLASAEAERGTAEIYLAFGQGFTRSTLQVLGSDGSLQADLFHNTLAGERKTLWLDFWNSFLAGWRRGGALRKSARRVLWRYLRFTLGLGPRRDAFYVGMQGSIEAFHEHLRAGADPPVDADQAADVLDWCEALCAEASGESAEPQSFSEPRPARPGEVVVLGASGFIGRRLVSKLRVAAIPVTCVLRRAHGLPPELCATDAQAGDAQKSTPDESEVRLLSGSLEDSEAVGRALQGARTVLHLATGGGESWEEVEHSMVQGSLKIAEAAVDAGVERFVYVSSIAALYTGADCGLREIEDSTDTDPEPEARPLYSRGKIAAEQALLELGRRRGLEVVIARPGVVVGAGTPMQHSGLGLWARDNHCVGWGGGEHPLPLVWVDDVAEALVLMARHTGSELDGKALNLCSRVPLNAREMVAELRRATGRDLHFHPRSLALSQLMEIGKWLVKKAGRRADAQFPSYRDLKARALAPAFTSRTARELLGWRPVEEREAFIERCVRIYAPEGHERMIPSTLAGPE